MKKYLFAPGPTSVPSEVLLAMAVPIIHHRAGDFVTIFDRVRSGLKWLFQTENEVFTLASSGTGGMETAVSNLLSPGDHALVINGGKFGERWTSICKNYGVKSEELKVEWGTGVNAADVERKLNEDSSIKAVYMQACETSTGVSHDVKAVADVVRRYENTVLVVDAISALGVYDIKTDEWGLDIVLTGSQKALMLPPGLALISVSEKAWKMVDKCQNSNFYFSLKKEKKNIGKSQTAYTPAVSLIVGLDKILEIMQAEGRENIFKRHKKLADATREGLKSMGLTLFPKSYPSDSLTAVNAPAGVDGQDIYKKLRDRYGITCAGGQDHLKGKIFRISHMGYADTFDVITVLAAIEMTLNVLGHKVELGSGVKKAQEILM